MTVIRPTSNSDTPTVCHDSNLTPDSGPNPKHIPIPHSTIPHLPLPCLPRLWNLLSTSGFSESRERFKYYSSSSSPRKKRGDKHHQ